MSENRTDAPSTHNYEIVFERDRTDITEHGDHSGYSVRLPCSSNTDTRAFYVEGTRFADGKCSLRLYDRDLGLLAFRLNDAPAKNLLRMIEEYLMVMMRHTTCVRCAVVTVLC